MIDTKIKGTTLEAIATSAGTMVQRVDSISFTSPFIPNLGNESKLIGAAFNKSLQGKVSELIAGTSGVFAIRVESNAAKVSVSDAATLKQNLIQAARMSAYRGADALRKSAKIEDNRAKFY